MTRGNAGTAAAMRGSAAILYGSETGFARHRHDNAAEQGVPKACCSLSQTLPDVLSVHIYSSPSHTFFHSFLHI
jgi:hypothetical protein